MARRIVAGIDVGTHSVRVVVAESENDHTRRFPTILGTGLAQSKGLRHGYIINQSDVTRAITNALLEAEKSSGVRIHRAYLSVSGVGLDEVRVKGESIVARADLEVTDLDVDRSIEDSEKRAGQKILNRRIIHTIPIRFTLDGVELFGRPVGMKGNKLDVETLFITAFEQHLEDLIRAVEEAGVDVIDVMASPIAGSFVTLTKAQKIAGCVLVNIGAETVSLVVFENNTPISLKVFPTGSTNITNDIALGLKISLEEAERVKRGAVIGSSYSKKKLDDIIAARLGEIFNLVDAHLKSIGKNGLLPAGIILSGGGSSGIATIEDIARAALKLPSKIGTIHGIDPSKFRDASWAVAYGLTIWGLSDEPDSVGIPIAIKAGWKMVALFKQFFKQFLP